MTGWLEELGQVGPPGRPAGWPAMGVRADDRPWPEPAEAGLLRLRRELAEAHPECIQTLPGTEAAVAEVCDLVAAPDLPAAATAQGDDLCVLAAEPGWPLVAGAVLFPSHWRLSDKLGRPLAEVHDRVPGYPAAQADRFLARLRPGQVAWRRNLLVHRDGDLHAPVAPATAGDAGGTHDVPVTDWWLRSERQTFRRLPRTGAVLFTIRTDTAPLAGLPGAARSALADRLEGFPAPWAPYAGVGPRLPELVSWLRQ